MSTLQKNLILCLVFGLTLPLAVVLSTRLATRSFERVKMQTQTLSVRGSADRLIEADSATWAFTVEGRDDKELKTAVARLEDGKAKVLAKLKSMGIPDGQLTASPLQYALVHPLDENGHPQEHIVSSQIAKQRFTLAGKDTAKVSAAALACSSLLAEGVLIDADAPCYLCTNLSAAKVQLLAEATANARERAKQLMGDSGVRLGQVRSANQGVFQITAPGSVDSSAGGEYDTSTPTKVIRATVTLEYALQDA